MTVIEAEKVLVRVKLFCVEKIFVVFPPIDQLKLPETGGGGASASKTAVNVWLLVTPISVRVGDCELSDQLTKW